MAMLLVARPHPSRLQPAPPWASSPPRSSASHPPVCHSLDGFHPARRLSRPRLPPRLGPVGTAHQRAGRDDDAAAPARAPVPRLVPRAHRPRAARLPVHPRPPLRPHTAPRPARPSRQPSAGGVTARRRRRLRDIATACMT
ncbi:hypothetical protein HIM_00628 [Hirsutella minnesotensis 3608]|nr:hypothetical protein HIM_00628 [Hirsutella minnesotensis 3608]